MATPFPNSVWKELREVGEGGCGGDNRIIQVELGTLHHLAKEG